MFMKISQKTHSQNYMKFSDSVTKLIVETRKIAERLDNDFIGLQHFLLAYNKFDGSVFPEFRLKFSDKKSLIKNIKGVKVTKTKSDNFPLTKDFEFVLESGSFQKWVLFEKVIEPRHLYLSIFSIERKNKSEYLRILESNHIKIGRFRKSMIEIQFNPIFRNLSIAKLVRKMV